MDAVTMYCEAAELLMQDYKEISYYSEVFEDAEEDVKKNEEITTKSMNLLQKAAQAIRGILKKIRECIDDILAYFKADENTKNSYMSFLKKVKENPELGKKKMTYTDYSKLTTAMNAEVKREEQQYRSLKDEELENKPSIAKDVQEAWDTAREKIKQNGKGIAKEVTVQMALEYAKNCRESAIEAKSVLKQYEMWCGSLESQLGKKEAKKVRKQFNRLSSRFKILRKLAGGKEQEYLTWKDAIKNVMTPLGASLAGADIMKRNETVGKAVTGTVKGATRIAAKGSAMGGKDAFTDQQRLKALEKNKDKEIQKIRDTVSNTNLRDDQKERYITVQKRKRDRKFGGRLDD
jgi:hypothetical protein